MNLQEVFNVAWQRFVVEGKPKSVSNHRCDYRNDIDHNVRCAIGWCLPVSLLDRIDADCKNQHSIAELIDYYLEVEELFEGCRVHDLQYIQSAHDGASPTDFNLDVERRLRNVAKNLFLTVPANESPV